MMWMCNDDESVDKSLGKYIFISNQLWVSRWCQWVVDRIKGVRGYQGSVNGVLMGLRGCQWGVNKNDADVV